MKNRIIIGESNHSHAIGVTRQSLRKVISTGTSPPPQQFSLQDWRATRGDYDHYVLNIITFLLTDYPYMHHLYRFLPRQTYLSPAQNITLLIMKQSINYMQFSISGSGVWVHVTFSIVCAVYFKTDTWEINEIVWTLATCLMLLVCIVQYWTTSISWGAFDQMELWGNDG